MFHKKFEHSFKILICGQLTAKLAKGCSLAKDRAADLSEQKLLLGSSGLYYKHVTIINDASSGVNK
jgi:hypothetical protein